MNLIGTRLGHFDIRDELGQGGMGAVYKAQQTDLDRTVALKVLLPHLTYDTSYIKRFRQEARSAARLEHPHIVPIYEVGEASVVAGEAQLTGPLPPLHYIAMKFIQGHTLKDAMESEQPLSVQQVLDIMTQVSSALDYAHQNGMIHRDIKPSNIMITREGWVYLTDFGLAREVASTADLTRTGTVMGTPEYMSPEQAEGLPGIGPATDIYALGVVLYQALSNALPFEADTPMAMLAARLVQAPRPLREARSELPPAIEAVVMRALARQPDDRYRTASEMIDALRKATEQWGAHMATVALPASPTAQSVAPPPSPPSPPPPPSLPSPASTTQAPGSDRRHWSRAAAVPAGWCGSGSSWQRWSRPDTHTSPNPTTRNACANGDRFPYTTASRQCIGAGDAGVGTDRPGRLYGSGAGVSPGAFAG